MDDTNTTDAGPVTVTVNDGVAVIDLDDGKANALGFDVLARLDAALDRAEEDDVTAVVLAGRDGKFSAGFDLSVMTSGADAAREMLTTGATLGLRFYMFPKPVVFAATGHALAMGAILLCCADVRIGADGPFKIGLNEVAIGMPVPGFAIGICQDRLTVPAFTAAIQLAKIHTPQEAREAGFLDEVVPADEVRDRAIAVAAELGSTLHRVPFQVTRRAVRGHIAERLEAELAEDLKLFDISAGR
jgi:enoyl-CoA hydratase